MRPSPEFQSGRLVPDQRELLSHLGDYVRGRGLAGCGDRWSEVVRTFGDGRAFVDITAWRTKPGRLARLLIEFGTARASDASIERVGFLDAHWDVAASRFGQIKAVCLRGTPADLERFAAEFHAFAELPMTAAETAAESD